MQQITAKKDIKKRRRQFGGDAAMHIREEVSPALQRAMDMASERGASGWLTVLPLDEHHFALHKLAFRDAFALRYGWVPSMVPTLYLWSIVFHPTYAVMSKGWVPYHMADEVSSP